MPTPQQTAAQMAAALNPEAKSFSPVVPQQGGTSRSSTSNNSGSNSAATAPLPAGEASGGNTNGGTPNQPQGGGGGGGGRGGFGGVAGAYVPPARQGGGNVGPPLHPQNQNPTLYNNNQQQGSVNGHGNASFLPSHSGGSGGGRFSGGGGGHGGNFGNNNNSGGNFGGNNNNNNFPPHHHHHHHHHGGGPGGNFGGSHHHHHHNQGGNMGGGGPHNQHHQHHHQHQYHHNHHMHHQSHQHNNPNMPPNQGGGGNFGNNNQGGGPGGNFPNHHHQHQHYNQHHHHNNNMNNNNNNSNNNFPPHHHHHHHNQMNNNNNNSNNNFNNNNNNNNGHPQNIPHPARGGRGRGMMNNNNPANNNRNREPRKAVVVLGAPKSGKTTLAKRIAKEFNNFHYIEAPLDKEKFETLSDELKALVQGEGAPGNNYNHDKMLVLDGFGADHDADLFYLGSVLKRYNFNVYGLVYLNLDKPADTISRRQERVPPSTAQMFGHAVAFETCAMYDSSPNLILIDADMNQDEVFEKFREMWQDAQMVPLEVVAPRVLRCIDKSSSWKMETYGEFKIVTSALEKALPSSAMTSGSSPMPLRSPYGPLAYQHFSRMFSRLPKYNVSLMTNGQRVVLFAFNGYLYFLPEHGYYVFRYEPANTPHHACRVTNWFDDLALKCEKIEGTCPLVLDAEYVIFQGDDYILLRDILVYGSEPCYNLPLSERIEKMASCMKNRAGDENNISIQVLPHRYANVENVKEIFSVWERAEETGEDSPPAQGTPNAATKVGVGVRLEPPGEYPVGQHDPSLLYWFEPDRIAIIARLWSVEDLGDDGQRFTVMAVDDSSGLEVKLPRDCPEKVTIPRDTITEEQLGEGHIVELILHKRLAPVPPASRGGRNQNRSQPSEILEFRFERRRWDIAVPMYHSTVSAIIHQVRHSWTREYFTKTCELVQSIQQQQNSLSGNDSGASTPMTPSSPSMN